MTTHRSLRYNTSRINIKLKINKFTLVTWLPIFAIFFLTDQQIVFNLNYKYLICQIDTTRIVAGEDFVTNQQNMRMKVDKAWALFLSSYPKFPPGKIMYIVNQKFLVAFSFLYLY